MSTSPIPPDALLRRLEWTVIRRLDGLLHGDYRTYFRGSGLDLADLREYQFHDDVRHIDWNVTARLATPYVREFNEERDLTAWFLLDLSGSVHFGSEKAQKSGVARDLVAVLARVLTRHGNRVGAMLYTDRVDTVLVPRSGRRHVLHLMHAIEQCTASPPRSPEGTRLGDLLAAAQSALTQSLIQIKVNENEGAAAFARAQKDAETRKVTAAAVGAQSRLEGQGEADRVLAIGAANAQATKLSVDAYGGPEFRLAEQNFTKFAEALTKINQPLVPQFLMSGTQGQEGGNAGLIPTAMLSSMFGRMMPDALEKLRQEAPQAGRKPNGS